MSTLDLHEAAALTKCHPERLREMAKARVVPSTKIGRRWIFPQDLLEQWMAGRLKMRPAIPEVFRYVRRRSGVSDRTPAWADQEAIRRIYAECRRISRLTGVKQHVDHEIPLHGRTVSGLHVAENLRILPGRENQSKGNSFECS